MAMVLMTQYFDTLREIGASGRTNTIMMPHSPGGLNDFFDQLRSSFMLATDHAPVPPSPSSRKTG
jgi:hypothetical protein